MPETSSITTFDGSLPQRGSTIVDDHAPAKVISKVMITDGNTGGYVPLQAKYQQMQVTAAAIVPPPLIKPMPKVDEKSL